MAGECFIRLRPRKPGDGLVVPLQLQILGAEMCPTEQVVTSGGVIVKDEAVSRVSVTQAIRSRVYPWS